MPIPRTFYLTLVCIFLACALPAGAATVNATWNASTDVPVTAAGYTATGNTVNFTLNFAPDTGANLTVVNNTGLPFISGTFSNLAQGQAVALSYGGMMYNYVAHYYGGTGNDLVLVWANNRVFGWGDNSYGRIGDGTTTKRYVMVPVTATGALAGKTIVSHSQGYGHSLALCTDGTVVSWGYNFYGQLGNNTTTSSSVPVLVNTTGGVSALYGKTVVAVAAGTYHSMALCSDGTVATWGYNFHGELGDNTTTQRKVPVAVNRTNGVSALYAKSAVGIAAGYFHCMVLCSDGTVVTWGSNGYGELGDNTTTQRLAAVAVNTASGVSALNGKSVTNIAAGHLYSMALCSDGTVVAWGNNSSGCLGDNTTTQRNVPVAVNGTSGVSVLYGKTVVALATGDHSLALCSDGTVTAWGDNTYGQLGDTTTTSRYVPVAVNTASGVSALSGKTPVAIMVSRYGGGSSAALCADGTMASWGDNADGDLGNNSTTNSPVPVAVNTSALTAGERLTVPYSGSTMTQCLMLVAGPSPTLATLPATAIGGIGATFNGTVNPNNGTALVTFEYGTTTAYGTSIYATPYTITGGTATAVSAQLISLTPATTYHYRVRAMAATGGDQTFTTLSNNASLASLVTSTGSLSPAFAAETTQYTVNLSGATDSITVTPTFAENHASATVNGTPVTSGNASGAISLGYGDSVITIIVTAEDGFKTQTYTLSMTQSIPTTVPAIYASAEYVPVSSNGFTATGRTVNFTLNYAPATGTNLTVVNNTGIGFINGRFNNLAQGQAVALSYGGVTYNYVAHYYGGTGNDLVLVWANNRAFSWGTNVYGRTGDGTTTQQTVMVPVTATGVLAGKTILSLSQSNNHSLALCSDGTVAAWGYNAYGQLGNNTTTNSTVPVAVNTASGVSALSGKTVVAVAAGESHSTALCSDGTVVAWGYNASGQLGNNTTANKTVPVAVNTASGVSALHGKTVVALATGYYHSVVVCSDGTAAAWGHNGYGQLGDSTIIQRNVPVAVNNGLGVSALYGKSVAAVAAGCYHSLVLCSDGTLAAWGANAYGGLGNNTGNESKVPVAVNTTTAASALYGKTVVSLAAGFYHSLALCSDGTVAAWGYNSYGQLGNNTTTNSYWPVPVNRTSGLSALYGRTVVAISADAAGQSNSSALCSDGTLVTWGYNSSGDLGNGTTTSSPVPVVVNTSPLVAGERLMSFANSRATAVSAALVAEPPPGATTLAATVISGASAALNGVVISAGGSVSVSFEYGTTTAYGSSIAATPATVTGRHVTAVAATLTGLLPLTTYHFRVNAGVLLGQDQTFTTPNNEASLAALTTSAGNLTPGFTSETTSYATPEVTSATSAVSFTPTLADSSGTLTATVNGVGIAVASGSPATASLGYGINVIQMLVTAEDGVTTRSYTLTVTRPFPATIAVGYASGSDVPVTSNASISPAGSTVNFTLAYAPATGTNLTVVNNTGLSFIHGTFDNLAQGQAVALSFGGLTYHFVANYYGGTGNDLVLVWANNRAMTWGYNYYRSTETGTTQNNRVPAALSSAGVLAGKTIVATATGGYHALALCSDGTLAAWGSNWYGELGDNSTTPSNVPVAVNTASGVSALYGKTVVAIAVGNMHSMALCSDGTVVAWGYNGYGELGTNSTTDSLVPVTVNSASGVSALNGRSVVAIAAGNIHSLALCDDGSVAAWGDNSDGQLGNNSTISSSVPVAVNSASGVSALYGKTVVALASGADHNLALCADGSVAAWGSNGSGQLGNNSYTNSSVPVAVNTASGVSALYGKSMVAITAGGYHSLVLCADGSLAAWGDNVSGDLGNNDNVGIGVPVAVNTASGVSALYGKIVVALSAGEYYSMALCTDGSLAAWGSNGNGALGNNSTNSSSVPTLVSRGSLAAGEQWNALGVSGNASNWTLAVAAAPAYATVSTQAATTVGSASATLTGIVVAAYDSMTVSFEHGTDTSYGSTAAATPTPVSTGAATPVSAVITGLAPLTTYHFRVNGSNSAGTLNGDDLTFTTLNNNAALASLSVSSGALSPAFASDTMSYTLDVPYPTSAITLGATLTDPNASMQINGAPSTSGTFNLAEGSNTLTILVTAQDGTTTQTYTLTVNRAAGPNLASLGLDNGTLSPVFDSHTTSYTVNVASTTSAIVVTPTVADGTSTVTVNGTAVGSGSASIPISLVYGDNAIATAVTSQDGSTTKTYAVLVTRGLPASFSAAFAAADTIPLSIHGLTATGHTLNLALNHVPVTGASLTVVNNTALGFISGTFDNLAQGQVVALSCNGITYHFIANYFGGTGNDLVLQWADARGFAWGNNSSAQLGKPNIFWDSNNNIPDAVTASNALSQRQILSFAAGAEHSLALCSDGSVAAWGFSFYGALGAGFFGFQNFAPVAVNAAPAGTPETYFAPSALYGRTVVAIAAGYSHSLALCSDGTVAAWGDNSNGQLGEQEYYAYFQSYVPVTVSTESGVSALAGKTVVAIAAGTNHSLALCSDGTLAGWGDNTSGQLGNLSLGVSYFPQAVNTANGVSALNGKTVVAISAGGYHSLALCSDGTVVAWGLNTYGQLGDNTTTTRPAPVAVNTASGVSALYGKTVVAISAGGYHSMALCSDGTVVAWGNNYVGQTGDNTALSQRNVPVAVNTTNGVSALYGKKVTRISAGSGHCMAMCADGTLAAWGYNGAGQVGASIDTVAQSVPFAVPRTKLAAAEWFASAVSGPSSSHSLALVATPPATVTSLAATALTSSSVTLSGMVNANNGYVPASFDIGVLGTDGVNVIGSPASATGSTAQATSVTLDGLLPGTTYYFRAKGGSYSGVDLTFTTLSELQSWRQQSFGTPTDTGLTADTADYDGDGIPNLLEFALNLDPAATSTLPTATAMNGAYFEYTYSRSSAAANAGTSYQVEWSSTLPAIWSSSGVTQIILSDDVTTQQVKAFVPINAATKMFVRLSVTAPP